MSDRSWQADMLKTFSLSSNELSIINTRRWAVDRGANSSLVRLQYAFALCDPAILTFDF